MTSHPSQSYTLKTCSTHPSLCLPSTAIVRTLCGATVISRPRPRARFFLSRCRRTCRSALPRRFRLRARNFRLFSISSLISLSLLFWSRGVGSAVPPRVAPPIFRLTGNLVLTHRLLSSFPLSAAVRQVWCHDRWYERSDLWIQLRVHRQRHRLCR